MSWNNILRGMVRMMNISATIMNELGWLSLWWFHILNWIHYQSLPFHQYFELQYYITAKRCVLPRSLQGHEYNVLTGTWRSWCYQFQSIVQRGGRFYSNPSRWHEDKVHAITHANIFIVHPHPHPHHPIS